jgi:beta-galactosidase/beta-glucuronidase
VPYTFQSRLGGIGEIAFHDVVWYRRTMQIPEPWRSRRVVLRFGAVDYEAIVWVNGQEASRHRGGHSPFAFEVIDALKAGDNTIVVRAFDPSTDRTVPRGKHPGSRARRRSGTRGRPASGSRSGWNRCTRCTWPRSWQIARGSE